MPFYLCNYAKTPQKNCDVITKNNFFERFSWQYDAISIIIEAYNKTGGTLIKKFETFFLEEFVGGITPYLKRVFGGA